MQQYLRANDRKAMAGVIENISFFQKSFVKPDKSKKYKTDDGEELLW